MAQFVSPTNLHCSQTRHDRYCYTGSLFPLRIYTALKQHCKVFDTGYRLFPLRIYTALKRKVLFGSFPICLFPLRIYTALKHLVG